MKLLLPALAVVCSFVAGCADRPLPFDSVGEAPATTTTTTTGRSTTSTTASAPTRRPFPDPVFWEVEETWQSASTTIVINTDGRIIAGEQVGHVSFEGTFSEDGVAAPDDYRWTEPSVSINVLHLASPKYDQVILVGIPADEEEDPPRIYELFVGEGSALRPVFRQALTPYSEIPRTPGAGTPVPLTLHGEGTLQYQEDPWTACHRGDYAAEVNRQIVILGFVGDVLDEVDRLDSSDEFRCENLAG